MSEIVGVATLHESPFNSIRRFDESGSEFWDGRELMPLLGYIRWQKFENAIDKAIDKAISSCENSGGESSRHFTASGNLVNRRQGGGSSGQNYKLTRYACYLVAFLVRDGMTDFLLDAGIDPMIARQAGLNSMRSFCPQLEPAIAECQKILSAISPSEEQWLTPTELGELVGMKARAMNTRLEDAGLQVRKQKDNGKSFWDLTESGKRYGKVFLATSTNNDWSGGQVRWVRSVLDVLGN
jgi:hypothetical protein